MKQRLARLLTVAVLAGGLVACGLSPQQVQPVPRLEGRLPAVAQGQAVAVSVQDKRSSPVLGTRGGLYENNQLTAAPATLERGLREEAEAALRMQGFVPQAGAGRQLDVQLTHLNYEVVEGRTVFGEVRLTASLHVNLRKPGADYQAEYVARLSKGFVKAPSAQTNDGLVSQVLTDALQRLFEDPAVAEFLAR